MNIPLETLEATIAAWENQKVMVRLPLFGTVEIGFYGTLIPQLNTSDEPQFLILREGNPGVTLVFQAYDVDFLYCPHDPEKRSVILKKAIDKVPFGE